MDKPKAPQPTKGPPGATPPPWRLPIWYFILMLLLLWMWQETFSHMNVRTIPYSEFKEHVARKEVVEVAIRQDEITGVIEPKARPSPPGSATNAVAPAPTSAPPANVFARWFGGS